ncbi:MAG: DUF5011 domain-containing protein [Bacteroidota bacterium]
MKTLKPVLFFLFILSFSIIFSCKKEKNDDTTPPLITILGNNPAVAGQGTTYTDAGATAYDETDGDITSSIISTNNVNTTDTGFYQVKYNVSDNSSNAAEEKTRTVHVIFM